MPVIFVGSDLLLLRAPLRKEILNPPDAARMHTRFRVDDIASFPHSELVRNWAFLLLFLIHIESNLQYNAQKKALFRHQVYRIFHCGECQARFTVFCGTFIILLSTHGKTPKASQRPSTGLRASEAPILTWMTWKRC